MATKESSTMEQETMATGKSNSGNSLSYYNVRVSPGGVQPYHANVMSAGPKFFAYCSTIAIYIYKLNGFSFQRLIQAHDKVITCIKWSPIYGNVLASCSSDFMIKIWNTDNGKKLANFRHNNAIVTLAWNQHVNSLVFIDRSGKCFLWDIPAWPKLDGENASGNINEKHGTVRLITYSDATMSKLSANSYAVEIAWNLEHSNCVAIGHACGRIVVKKIGKSEKILYNKSKKRGKVLFLQWDTRSVSYLLVGYHNGSISLWDVDSCTEAQVYNTGHNNVKKRNNKEPVLNGLQWIHGQVGNFLSVEYATGKLKVWNVSQKEALGSYFVKSEKIKKRVDTRNHLSLVCPLMDKGYDQKSLVSFTDGSVGLYNLKTHRLEYQSFEGHRETIFGMAFCPTNKNFLATSSFDGMVKMWHFPTMTLRNSLEFQSSVYNISFSPCGKLLVCVTENGIIAIFNALSKGERGQATSNNNKNNISNGSKDDGIIASFCTDCRMYNCDWNQIDDALIVATGETNYAYVIDDRGGLFAKFRHPAECFGCQWKIGDARLFVTGCHDGIVRIFDSGLVDHTCLIELDGHSDRVFNVAFSPLNTNFIASCSNDKTIRVWKIQRINHNEETRANLTGSCRCVLNGHSENVRALKWCTELPFILYSGSWDATIRIWNTDTNECLCVIKEHQADVYQIASHPGRPFRFISCSRDTTLRVWGMNGHTKYRIISNFFSANFSYAKRDYMGIVLKSSLKRPYLCSNFYKKNFYYFPFTNDDNLGQQNDRQDYMYKPNINNWIQIFEYIECAEGIDEFLNILIVQYNNIMNKNSFSSNISTSKGNVLKIINCSKNDLDDDGQPLFPSRVLYPKNAVKNRLQEAKELITSATMRRFSGIGNLKSSDKLKIAYEKYIRLGEIKKACEALIKIGKWEKAISLSPGVSIDYWKKLSARYAQHLDENEDKCVLDYHVAVGDLKSAQEYLISEGSWDDAVILSTAWNQKKQENNNSREDHQRNRVVESGSEDDEHNDSNNTEAIKRSNEIGELIYPVAQFYEARNEPLLAAATYIGVGQFEKAIQILLEFNELFAAFIVALTFRCHLFQNQFSKNMYVKCVELFASCFEKCGNKIKFSNLIIEEHLSKYGIDTSSNSNSNNNNSRETKK